MEHQTMCSFQLLLTTLD